MATITQEILSLFYKPEYIALLVSVLAITVNVYISCRNRKYALAKEEYFKLQQIVEKIISKLLILEKQRLKLIHFFELSFKADQNKNMLFVDANDTFNKADFEKEGEEVAAFIGIYFEDLADEWNFCLNKMSDLFTQVFMLRNHIDIGKAIDWKKEADDFNKTSTELGIKPKEISEKLKKKLDEFKEKNL